VASSPTPGAGIVYCCSELWNPPLPVSGGCIRALATPRFNSGVERGWLILRRLVFDLDVTQGCELSKPQGEAVPTDIRQADAWLSFGLAFVGGYGDAASFVLAKTFTGHVTGNLVLGAIAIAAHDGRALLGHFSAIVTFLIGVLLSTLIARPLKVWAGWSLLPIVMGIEVILIIAASLALASGVPHGVGIFVIVVSLAFGLQNGAFRRAGGISVHTTYLTGMLTRLISSEAEKYTSQAVPPPVMAPDPEIRLLGGIWIAFVLGAATGAAMALRFQALGMLGAALLLITLILRDWRSAHGK
jgi:uncharacterized membrane protein YoaK (UPF0700 family)